MSSIMEKGTEHQTELVERTLIRGDETDQFVHRGGNMHCMRQTVELGTIVRRSNVGSKLVELYLDR